MTERKHAPKCARAGASPDPDAWCDCDGFHTIDDLYDHRIALWIALCAAVGVAWRSKRHSDGTTMDGWFLLGLGKARGFQMTYHLPAAHWGDTSFAATLERAPEFDGHTPDDVLARLADLARDCAPTSPKRIQGDDETA